MILENRLEIPADPDEVFALLNDVERVAGCLPGATLDGQEDDAYLGHVKLKVGPINAAYSGKVRFTEVVPEDRRLRLMARGADTHGNGDAEADVMVTVNSASGGSTLDLRTDLSIRGKLAQFGKGAIGTVANRLLGQFASNLADQLHEPSAAESGPIPTTRAAVAPPASADEPLDGWAILLSPETKRYASLAAVAIAGLFHGYLFGRIRTQDKLIKELQRACR